MGLRKGKHKKSKLIICPKCGHNQDRSLQICTIKVCNQDFRALTFCNCGAPISKGNKYCCQCGKDFRLEFCDCKIQKMGQYAEYCHMCGRKYHDAVKQSQPPVSAIVICPHCHKESPRKKKKCVWCARPTKNGTTPIPIDKKIEKKVTLPTAPLTPEVNPTPTTPVESEKKCPSCGEVNPKVAKFCRQCASEFF